ncbi:hypothetical protein V8E51_012862 [Hyaloscypha variabilis]
MHPNITPMTRPSNSQDLVLSKVGPKPLPVHKSLRKTPHPEPESIETQRPQVPEPQITSTRRAIQAGEHTLEFALRPTQRGPRRPTTEQARPLCSPKPPNPAPNRHLREYRLPRAPSWEHRRQMGHDLGELFAAMEFFSLNEHIDLLERQENSTQRIDLQELLESENFAQVPSVSDTGNMGDNHGSGSIFMPPTNICSPKPGMIRHAQLPLPSPFEHRTTIDKFMQPYVDRLDPGRR